MASRGFIELLRLTELGDKRKKGQQLSSASQWLGVAFRVGGYQLVAPLGDVAEVLTVSDMTTVPLSQAWLLGIANIRGRLLPVTHLGDFLGIKNKSPRLNEQRVLVIDKPQIFTGLQVDQIFGIQTFSQRQYEAIGLPLDSPLEPYTHGRFTQNQQEWYIFMPSLLAEDSRYLEVAL